MSVLLCGVGQTAAQDYSVTALPLEVAFETSLAFGQRTAVNGSGQVVGSVVVGCELGCTFLVYHAALFDGTTTRDLNPPSHPDHGEARSYGVAINARGHVVLDVAFASGYGPVYLHDDLGLRSLGTLGGRVARAAAINDSGQVVGHSEGLTPSGTWATRAFLYDGTIMRDLGTLNGWDHAYATDINNAGQVVGWSTSGAGGERAFLYNGTTMRDLGTLGGTYSRAIFINDAGHVVGISGTASGTDHAFLYDGTTMYDLGTFGGNLSEPTGLNETGSVAGYAYTGGPCCEHAFLYEGTTMRNLGTLGGARSHANGINADGYVVGYADTGLQTSAFLYDGAVMRDLNEHIPGAPADMRLDRAYFITDNGLVVATSPADDALFGRRWVLLTPVKANQTITITQHAPATAVVNTSFTVTATASSGLAVAITTSGVCTGSGSGSATITMTSATGACTVVYNQAGNANYNAAPQVSESVTAQSGSTLIATTISAVSGSGSSGGGTATLSATLKAATTALGGNTVTFTLFGNPVGTATTDRKGNASLKVSLSGTAAGEYVNAVGASFTGNSTYAGSSGEGDLTLKGKK